MRIDPEHETELDGSGPRAPLIVLVGASAGGLEALNAMFKAAPHDTGMAFVVAQHLSPDYRSMMPELLARQTSLRVTPASDDVVPEPDTVYVIEPQTTLRIQAGRLRVFPAPRDRPSLPINSLFELAAEDLGARCAGVILSGTGSDGANGLLAIKDHGGTVVIQDPATARFDGMPQAALRTGVADMVLSPELIVQELVNLTQAGPASYFGLSTGHGAVVLTRILTALRNHTGVDFNHYKPSTIVRRVQRRMDQRGVDDPREYADSLRNDPAEAQHLYHDLLIGVTRFLRDPGAIEAVQRVAIPRLLRMPGTGPLRVWVPGCATGEEAYSIAMLLDDALTRAGVDRDFRVFATDIDGHALENASRGEFPQSIREAIPEELLGKYFVRSGEIYTVQQDLRDKLLFSRQNVIEDPPFSRLEMVSCRNLLIYLKPPVQDRVLRLLSLSLVDNGILWLGTSETVGPLDDHFEALEPRWRLFLAKSGRRRQAVVPTVRGTLQARTYRTEGAANSKDRSLRTLEQVLLSYAPPTLIVDSNLALLYRFGDLNGILVFPEGHATLNVRELLPPEISGILITGLARARERDADVVFRSLVVTPPTGEARRFDLRVRHVPSGPEQSETFALIFEGVKPLEVDSESISTETLPADFRSRLDTTERELRETRENLQATIEELESANEELQSTNEELVSSNEELQSTNEELQSVNEELHTVNMEHEQKVEQLVNLTEDLDNVLSAVEVGILVLDSELRLRRFNLGATRYFSVLSQDVGRPLAHLTHTLAYRSLIDDASEVIRTGEAANIRCTSHDGQVVRIRVRPHNHGDRIGGVVMTVTDMTEITEANRRVEDLNHALEQSGLSVVILDLQGRIIRGTPAFAQTSGRDEAWLKGQSLLDMTPSFETSRVNEALAALEAGSRWRGIMRGQRPDGSSYCEAVDFIPMGGGSGLGLRVGVDLTSLLSGWPGLVNGDEGRELYMWDVSRDRVYATSRFLRLFDADGPLTPTPTFAALSSRVVPEDQVAFRSAVERSFEDKRPFEMAWGVQTQEGLRTVKTHAQPFISASGDRMILGELVETTGPEIQGNGQTQPIGNAVP